jgi:hypothetical protein
LFIRYAYNLVRNKCNYVHRSTELETNIIIATMNLKPTYNVINVVRYFLMYKRVLVYCICVVVVCIYVNILLLGL